MKNLFGNLEENKHARNAPSSASRWASVDGCPGSIVMAEGAEDTSGAAAQEGTKAHELCEYMLNSEIRSYSDIDSRKYSEEMFSYALEYCKYVESLNLINPYVEFRVPLFYSPEEAGTVDCTGIDKYDILHVVDFKFGKGVFVEVKNNLQLIIYAISVLDQTQGHTGIKAVRTHIFQPRMGNIAYEEYTAKQLEEFRVKISEAESKTWLAKPILNPTKKNCVWCKAKATCPAVAKKALKSIGADFENLDTIPETCDQEPDKMTPSQLLSILRAKSLVTSWLKSIEDYVIQQLSSGNASYDSIALKRGNGRKVWKDEKAAIEMLKKTGNSDLIKTTLPTPLQVVSALKRAKKQAPEELNKFVFEKEGKLSVITEKNS